MVVIGGGINGVAIARECARANRRTLLLEQDDFSAGTTSRSTRIIHGGLRYLEQGEIGMVRESLRERQRLLRERPHLVRSMQLLLALGDKGQRSALKVRMGLWLYRRLGGRSLSRSARGEIERFESLLDSGQRWSIFSFEDAQCEFPERLVAEWLVEAAQAGAVVRNHSQVLAVDVRFGRATGVLVRDLLVGKQDRVEAGWVINATGPWADRLCQRSGIATHDPMIGGVRGSHIVLPRFRGAPENAVFTEAVDGRPIFVVPWNGQVLVGTTEVPDVNDPAKTEPSREEVDYLLKSLHTLLPAAQVSWKDVCYAFAGVRPLPFVRDKSPSAITRRHFLHDHAGDGVERMISVIGGKLTTAGELARQCARLIHIPVREPKGATLAPVGEMDATLDELIAEISGLAGISMASAEAIVEWHGRRTVAIAQIARRGPEMRATLCPHSEHIVAEAVDAFQNEYAITLGDVLLRRVPVALGGCWSEECSRVAAARIAVAMGWSDSQSRAALAAFEAERNAFLRRPYVRSE